MSNACAGSGQLPQLLVVEVDAMGVPYVRPGPAQRRHIFQRAHAVIFQRPALLVPGLAQVGVEPHAVLPGQNRALPQQLRADGEGGAGGQSHLMHGAGAGVVIDLNHPGGVPQNFVHRLYHAVRRQAAILTAQVHAAPGGKHPHTQLLRGGKLRA